MAGSCLPASVIACVGASLLVGCGGGTPNRSTTRADKPAPRVAGSAVSDRIDLRSPDVDARMDPASHDTVLACPGTGRVEVRFDPRGTVALVSGGRPLVYATVGTRAVNRACRPRGSLNRAPRGILRGHNEATTLTCAVPRSARFEVYPITVTGREVGSTVAVLVANRRSIVLYVVLESRDSRIYYGRACRAG
jgi:hypothetical protein